MDKNRIQKPYGRVRLLDNSTSRWHHIEVDGERITCTAEHPFFILNATADTPVIRFEGQEDIQSAGRWVAAKDLKAGDKVLLGSGKSAITSATSVEDLAEPEATFNFEVRDFHTYYVGEQSVLVHNACPDGKPLPDVGEPNTSGLRYDTQGKLYSAKTYGADGRVVARIDFQGTPHAVADIAGMPRIIPHVHPVVYDLGLYYRELPAVLLPFFIGGL